MNQAIIGLGSNIDPAANIAKACQKMELAFRILKHSQFKITKPIDALNHPDFINGALLIETSLSQTQLKEHLNTIEEELGRPRHGNRSAPRTIDLDILVWNRQIIDPDLHTRDFLKEAVAELLPEVLEEIKKGNL